jgi:hypothetical protein
MGVRWREIVDQNLQRALTIARAAHEDIDCGKSQLRPRVDGDMGFGEQHDSRNACTIAKAVKVAAQDVSAGMERGTAQQAIERKAIAKDGSVDAM